MTTLVPPAADAAVGDLTPELEVRDAVERLAASMSPFIVGVRHHSPALAAVIPALLEAANPDRLLVELPPELEGWLPWLADEETQPPVALAAVREHDAALAFYPFADFSPELAAIRWATRRGIPVQACDLPWSSRAWGREAPSADRNGQMDAEGIRRLYDVAGVSDGEELWDRLVEVRAPGSAPEAVRRAALAVGWTLRHLTTSVSEVDLAREAWMRREIAVAASRLAVVVGAFHAPALLAGDVTPAASLRPTLSGGDDVVTSLIPYTFQLLDSRSGYPAGIRDPEWQQAVLDAGLDPATIQERTTMFATAIAAALRDAGHAAGTVDATEITRLASDLARIRGHAAPGRRELVEACAAVLAQGDVLGRGRAVARAMEGVLVGNRHGRLAAGTPRSGLAPHVEQLLHDLRLPGPRDPEADLRLDPLRSGLDRRRHVALTRLAACGIPYGRLIEGSGLGIETLTRRWSVSWQPATSAVVELAGTRGVTLDQAATGAIRARLTAAADHADGEDDAPAVAIVAALREAAECGLAHLVDELMVVLAGLFLERAGLAELLAATDELERIARGHVPGLQPPEGPDPPLIVDILAQLLAAAVRSLEAVAGSTRPEDALALAGLVRRRSTEEGLGDTRIGWALDRICRDGSPLMQGAAEAISVIVGRRTPDAYAGALGSWVDGASDATAHADLAARLRGTVLVAAPVLESARVVLASLSDRIEVLGDEAFIARLPALRDGFDLLSVAGRGRLMAAVTEGKGLDQPVDLVLDAPAEWEAMWATADAAGLAAVRDLLPDILIEGSAEVSPGDPAPDHAGAAEGPATPGSPLPNRLSILDRWRLILGHEPEALEPDAARLASALDELYGAHGEGSRAGVGAGSGPSRFPTAREWSEELEALFGERVREEVLGRAAERGNASVIDRLEPEAVTPSVDLLEQILGLAGAVPEASLGRLRALVRRIVDELVRQLAITVRPALTGSMLARPTRRRGSRLHLARTVRANLRTVRPGDDGAPLVIPEQPWFYARAQRSFDWRVVLCVDVSGSMEPATIYAALMAAIINGLPSVTTHFVAFSDTVVDLTGRVDDPLALLLEIRVGGGTNIARALQYARSLVTVPRRTIVVVVSDFEEGGSVQRLVAETRALASGGSRLIGLAALDHRGAPRFDAGIAGAVVAAGMPIAALTPTELAAWVGEQLRGG